MTSHPVRTDSAAGPDPLPSWRDGATKRAVIDFISRVTTQDHPDFVPARDRIAVFDNDGTLWPEMPLPIQFCFLQDRARAMIAANPALRGQEPYRSVIAGDIAALRHLGGGPFFAWVAGLHAGLSAEEAEAVARDWLALARHPVLGRPFTELAYQPMRELLTFLRANGFRTWVVTGSGADFVRALAQEVYSFLPEQVIGSTAAVHVAAEHGAGGLTKLPRLEVFVDRESKAATIATRIGRRPTLACGNSDSDLAMFEYAASGPGPSLVLIIHHDDPDREWAYEKSFDLSPLDEALREASLRGWLVVSMRDDFRVIYAPTDGVTAADSPPA